MDRLDAMSTLLAVAKAGSLSAAARRSGTPLATVSRRISELEAHLKTRLLHRSNRRLVPTDAGQAYLESCRRILDDIDEAERTARGEYVTPSGALALAAPVVFGRWHLLPVVTAFLTAFPTIDIRLCLADRLTNLMEEHIDVALRIGSLPDSNLHATRIGALRRIVCGSPAYLAGAGVPRTPACLASHACITFEGLMSPTSWTLGSGRSEVTVPIRSRLTVTTAEAAVDAAIAGLGLTRVLSYQAARAVRDGSLVVVLRDFEPEHWPVHLLYLGGRMLPLKVRAFLDFAAPRLRDDLSALALSGEPVG